MFAYDETTAPASIPESGAGSTVLDLLTVYFFDPADDPMQSLDTFVSGVSNSSFFQFNFDTTTETLVGSLDVGGGTSAIGTQSFGGTLGGLPQLRAIGISGDTLLDYQDPGVVTVRERVPEPSSLVLSLLGWGLLGEWSSLKRKHG